MATYKVESKAARRTEEPEGMRNFLFNLTDADGDLWDTITVPAHTLREAWRLAKAEAAKVNCKPKFEGSYPDAGSVKKIEG